MRTGAAMPTRRLLLLAAWALTCGIGIARAGIGPVAGQVPLLRPEGWPESFGSVVQVRDMFVTACAPGTGCVFFHLLSNSTGVLQLNETADGPPIEYGFAVDIQSDMRARFLGIASGHLITVGDPGKLAGGGEGPGVAYIHLVDICLTATSPEGACVGTEAVRNTVGPEAMVVTIPYPGSDPGARFGSSFAVNYVRDSYSGDGFSSVLAIGAPGENEGRGAVYIFKTAAVDMSLDALLTQATLDGAAIYAVHITTLQPAALAPGSRLGHSLAMAGYGTVILSGAPGATNGVGMAVMWSVHEGRAGGEVFNATLAWEEPFETLIDPDVALATQSAVSAPLTQLGFGTSVAMLALGDGAGGSGLMAGAAVAGSPASRAVAVHLVHRADPLSGASVTFVGGIDLAGVGSASVDTSLGDGDSVSLGLVPFGGIIMGVGGALRYSSLLTDRLLADAGGGEEGTEEPVYHASGDLTGLTVVGGEGHTAAAAAPAEIIRLGANECFDGDIAAALERGNGSAAAIQPCGVRIVAGVPGGSVAHATADVYASAGPSLPPPAPPPPPPLPLPPPTAPPVVTAPTPGEGGDSAALVAGAAAGVAAGLFLCGALAMWAARRRRRRERNPPTPPDPNKIEVFVGQAGSSEPFGGPVFKGGAKPKEALPGALNMSVESVGNLPPAEPSVVGGGSSQGGGLSAHLDRSLSKGSSRGQPQMERSLSKGSSHGGGHGQPQMERSLSKGSSHGGGHGQPHMERSLSKGSSHGGGGNPHLDRSLSNRSAGTAPHLERSLSKGSGSGQGGGGTGTSTTTTRSSSFRGGGKPLGHLDSFSARDSSGAAAAGIGSSIVLHWPDHDGEGDRAGLAGHVCNVPYEELRQGEKLGKGSFKTVYAGEWGGNEVAITHVSPEMVDHEVAIMANLSRHPNLVALYGLAQPPPGPTPSILLVMELVKEGSLNHVLHKHPKKLSEEARLAASLQICAGMTALSREGVTHADLAARNVLVQSIDPIVVKVGDFGLSKTKPLYYGQPEGIPVRWSAPEVIKKGRWTEKSDVWAFGVTMWEIYTDGDVPYGYGWSNSEVADYVTGGGLLKRPAKCPSDVWEVILRCWQLDAEERPPFTELGVLLYNIKVAMYSSSVGSDSPTGGRREVSAEETFNWSNIKPPKRVAGLSGESVPSSPGMPPTPVGGGFGSARSGNSGAIKSRDEVSQETL